jgi:putative two-component system response regulator
LNEKADVLIVDDKPENLQVLAAMLRESGYRPRPVVSAELALQAAERAIPDLILLDIMMPEIDGYELCRRFKENLELRDVPVIFVSALSEAVDKVKAFGSGGVDYITKPYNLEELRARIDTHLSIRRMRLEIERYSAGLENVVREQMKEIRESQAATIFALAKLAQSRDDETGGHLERVRAFCELLARIMNGSRAYSRIITRPLAREIVQASPLHDIGKVGVPDAILLKPGKLTPQEFEAIKRHTIIGAETLRAVHLGYPQSSFITVGIEIVRSHHERWDGSGYPDGLAGEAIPLPARIMAFADVYDALRSDRVYKRAMPHAEAMEIMTAASGSHFDPGIMPMLVGHQGEFEELYSRLEAETKARTKAV